jgi:hypothetical protein
MQTQNLITSKTLSHTDSASVWCHDDWAVRDSRDHYSGYLRIDLGKVVTVLHGYCSTVAHPPCYRRPYMEWWSERYGGTGQKQTVIGKFVAQQKDLGMWDMYDPCICRCVDET